MASYPKCPPLMYAHHMSSVSIEGKSFSQVKKEMKNDKTKHGTVEKVDFCKSPPKQCNYCKEIIMDNYVMKIGNEKMYLHSRCLCCTICKNNLEQDLTCFVKDGLLYCNSDYLRYKKNS